MQTCSFQIETVNNFSTTLGSGHRQLRWVTSIHLHNRNCELFPHRVPLSVRGVLWHQLPCFHIPAAPSRQWKIVTDDINLFSLDFHLTPYYRVRKGLGKPVTPGSSGIIHLGEPLCIIINIILLLLMIICRAFVGVFQNKPEVAAVSGPRRFAPGGSSLLHLVVSLSLPKNKWPTFPL